MRERWARFMDAFRRRRLERDLREELQFHRQQLERAAADDGADAAEARRLARRRLGDPDRITETARDGWSIRWIDAARRDLRHGLRTLRRTPGFAAVAIGTLGAGLALAVVVTAVVNAYVVRGLPYPEGHRLFSVSPVTTVPGAAFPQGLDKLDWASLGDVVELAVTWDLDAFTIRGGDYPLAANGAWVTAPFLEAFGIRPLFGPGIQPEDFQIGRPLVALISHRLWQSRFGGDPGIVGRRFDAFVTDRPDAAETFTVVGVLPADFWHTNTYTEVLAPLKVPQMPYVVRVREGVQPEHVQARIDDLTRGVSDPAMASWRFEVRPSHDTYVAQIRPLLLSIAMATALVLLIACANVAVLMLVRATSRRREMAVRKAIGASAAQVVRALLAETAVLAIAIAVAGAAAAWFTLGAIAPMMERYLGRPVPGGVDALHYGATAILVTMAAGIGMTLVCAVAPLWAASRAPVALALHGGQKGTSGGHGQRRARTVLIVVEVAACLTLLAGAALMIRSALRVLDVDLGLDARDVAVGRFNLRQRSYPDAATRSSFLDRFEREAQAAGVRVALGNSWPLQAAGLRDVSTVGTAAPQTARAGAVGVSGGYFDVLSIDVVDGRAFALTDTPTSERVAIVSRTLADRLWPGQRAIGQSLRFVPPPNAPPGPVYAVVGVVADTRYTHTDNDLADVYVALGQAPSLGAFVYARAPGAEATEAALRSAIARVDPEVALATTRPMADILDQQRAGPRFLARVLTVFAGFASVLALVGLYGVIAYTVRQREREIAVRLAIGAEPAVITRLFVLQGARVLAVGLAIGVLGALALGRVLETQLFGIGRADAFALWATTAAFGLCGLLAVAWPARVAASADPAMALKE